MTPVRAPDGRDPVRMPRHRQPVVDRGPDLAALHRWFTRPRVSGDEEDDPLAASDRPLQAAVDGLPSAVQAVAVQVQRTVDCDGPRLQPPIPVPVQRAVDPRRCRWQGGWRTRRRHPSSHAMRSGRLRHGHRDRRRLLRPRLTAKRGDGRRHPRPELFFLRAELAHAPRSPARWPARRFPWATGSVRGPSRPCRRRSAPPRRHGPRRCRTGWRP